MEYMFWNTVANSVVDGTICHLGWDRVWQSVLNYFRLSDKRASLWVDVWAEFWIEASSQGLRIDILEKDTKACMTLISKAWIAKQVALTGVIQAQGEKRGAAGDKSDRSVGLGGRWNLTLESWEPWRMDSHFLLRMWPQTSYFKFAASPLKWT